MDEIEGPTEQTPSVEIPAEITPALETPTVTIGSVETPAMPPIVGKHRGRKFVLEEARRDNNPLTFDDVLLVTGCTEVLPKDVDLTTRFSRRISSYVPLSSAAMDNVTDHRLAIRLPMNGGIGVIHRNFSIKDQAREVDSVKNYLHGLTRQPFSQRDKTVEALLRMREEKGLAFYKFPIIDDAGELIGLVTWHDLKYAHSSALLSDIMTKFKDLGAAPSNTSIKNAWQIMGYAKIGALPLIDEPDRTLRGMYFWKDVNRIMSGDARFYNVDDDHRLRVAAAIGSDGDAFERAAELVSRGVDVLVIDNAHADNKSAYGLLKKLKSESAFDRVDVVVGNISNEESAVRLARAGADGIKVGQAVGSICTTGVVTGTGFPQLSAVHNCYQALIEDAKENPSLYQNGIPPITADGGFRHSGDITKALAAGASCVMIGNLFAGTDEAPGEKIWVEGRTFKYYRGMGSEGAMKDSEFARDRYNQAEATKLVPEGIEGRVKYTGSLDGVVFSLLGGLRAGMGNIGARTTHDLWEKSHFVKVSNSGQREMHPHDITIVKDAPNYKMSG